MKSITDLPNEILLKIFALLPQIDHYAVGLVSHRFQDLIDNTKWCVETSVLKITEATIREVREAIENKNTKFSFKRVKIEKVSNIGDLEYILKSIGKEIEYLSMRRTEAFHLLKENVINLESLEIYFDHDFRNNFDDESFDLCFFPLLKELSFIGNNGREMESTTVKLLEQIKAPANTSSLKHFKLDCQRDTKDFLTESLLHHSSTLESLTIDYFSVKNFTNWKILFSRLKNLKKLCLTRHFTPEIMNAIFSMLPKETLLEHLVLYADDDLDYNEILPLIVEKCMNSLQYLELNNFRQLTDVDAFEFGKLHKLRVLKVSGCENITKNAFLEGIAKEQNMFIEELLLDNLWNLDDLGLGAMVSRFPNLRFLTLIYLGSAITNTALASIFRFSTRLRSFHIEDCSLITDEGMIGFGNEPYSINRLRHLVKLRLIFCDSLTDRTLIEALKLPALRSLELYNYPKMTLKGLESLMKACPLLEFLSIPSTVFTHDNDLFAIGNGLKHLRQLQISNCEKLTKEVCDHLKEVFTDLQHSTTNATFSRDCRLELECYY